MKRKLLIKLLLLVLILSGFQIPVNNTETGTKVKLYVIGDSTASPYDASSFPRTGWAQVLQGFFNPDSIEVVDKALSGRSSKSYYTDSNGWPSFSGSLAAGDYLFIQFGHNDSKTDEERHTDPYTTYKEYLKKYIDEARAKGAIPVLLTSIHRNGWSGDQIKDSHGDYPPAMRELAVEENVPLIDLTKKTELLFEAYGKDLVTNEFYMNLPASLYRNYPTGNSDNSHLQIRGAYEVSKLVKRAIDNQQAEPGMMKLFRGSHDAGFVKTLVDEYNNGSVSGKQIAKMGATTTLKATDASGYLFDYFIFNEAKSIEREINIDIIDSLQLITAYYSEAFNVRIRVDPSGKSDYSGNGNYHLGDTVILTADPDPGYSFISWTVDDNIVSSDSVYTFIMDGSDLILYINVELASSVIDQLSESTRLLYNSNAELLSVKSPIFMEHIQLIDMSGKVMQSVSVNQNEYTFDLKGLHNGIYIVKIKANNKIFSRQILKH